LFSQETLLHLRSKLDYGCVVYGSECVDLNDAQNNHFVA